jgi:DNA mismatch endonuclease (patch repair protein)
MSLTRSEHMSRIRDRDTRPERILRALLWTLGFRYRLRCRIAGVRPDIVFPRVRVAVFIDGCFWHGCPIHYALPRTRNAFWAAKLRENVDRDVRQTKRLQAEGFVVLRIWTHEIVASAHDIISCVAEAVSHRQQQARSSWRIREVEQLEDNKERRHLISLDSRQCIQTGRRNVNSYQRA